MLSVSLLFFVLLQMQTTFAGEPAQTKTLSPDEIAKLINRIDQLENRIKDLERQATKPSIATTVPDTQLNTDVPQSFQPPATTYQSPPTYFQPPPTYYQPGYRRPMPPHSQAAPSSPYQPPYSQNNAVPDSWKPFNFNGMQYYIIPVEEATRLNRPQGNDKENYGPVLGR